MINLAALGFATGGILFAAYAVYLLQVLARRDYPARLNYFGYGYLALAGAFLIWGIAAATRSQQILNASVMLGNALMLAGTICMLKSDLKASRVENLITVSVATFFASLFFLWRAAVYPPAPRLADGVLLFNSAMPVTVVFAALILVVWLPAGIHLAQALTNTAKLRPLRFMFVYVYGLATLASLLFISARTPLIATLSFVGVVLCFVMLLASTVLADGIHRKIRGAK